MAVIRVVDLAKVLDSQSLFSFLHHQLEWPVDPEDSFTYPLTAGPDNAAVQAGQVPPFGDADPFAIVLVEFSDKFKRTTLRATLRDIRRKMKDEGKLHGKSTEDLVFICACDDYGEVRFAHFVEREGKQPTLSVFGWERRNADSTATVRRMNLECLRMPKDSTLFGKDPDEWRKQWLQAWDGDSVTKEFFKTYRLVFKEVEGMVQGVEGDKRLFTQRLFNRLLFIRFLEKKNWLQFPAVETKDEPPGYLHPLFLASTEKGENFYHDRLYWLFFHGLGVLPESQGVHSHPDLLERRGEVPYLNGGLFEMEPGDEQGVVSIPNEAFELILNDLFLKFNFTITESMPDDVEVAVDPEMLGKVFEELVTGRHESGSYYTPRPIVSFMCKEALKGYLASVADALARPCGESHPGEGAASSVPTGVIERLVDFHDAEGITVPEAKKLLKKLAAIKVVDPACGSGAYLLGMLQELYQLTILLDTTAEQATEREDYDRKLQIIQNNLYGVDIDPFAVNVARLRLWLSLSVDAKEPLPLPNLDFKIEAGDSLRAPLSGASAQTDTRGNLIEQFRKAKADYADPTYGGDKRALKLEIQSLRNDIAGWTHPGQTVHGFDWDVEFAEVFASKPPTTTIGGTLNVGYQLAEQPEPGGFDVVLANPPYVRQEKIKDVKPHLKRVFEDVHTGMADLYVYFYARAIQLLRSGGTLAFISSNKWFRADYGKKLRARMAACCRIGMIADFGELPVFNAGTFPMIFIARKDTEGPQTPVFVQVKTLDEPYPDVLALVQQQGGPLPAEAIQGDRWTLSDLETIQTLRKMETDTVPLGEYVNGQIYYGVKTGFNRAFVIDGAKRAELIAEDPASAEIIKPLAVGDDIRKWHIRERDRWLIVTRIGVDMGRYSAVLKHLKQWEPQLRVRQDQGNHWWELRACAYYDAFEKPKIVFPEIAKEPRFSLDPAAVYPLKTVFSLIGDELFLLSILNSAAGWGYLSITCSVLGDQDKGGRLTLQETFVRHLPVPSPAATDRTAIETLVQKCLDAKGVGCEEWEAEIDERVAALYGL